MDTRSSSKDASSQIPEETSREKASDEVQKPTASEAKSTLAHPSHMPTVSWTDFAGLEEAIKLLKESVILPLKFPQLFVDCNRLINGIFIFGPSGCGKTMLVHALATEAGIPLFHPSRHDLLLCSQERSDRPKPSVFEVARREKPSIVFIDDLDNLSCRYDDTSSDHARRVRSELFRQMRGGGYPNEGVLFVAATNAPWDVDRPLVRSFERHIYTPLPPLPAREALLRLRLGRVPHCLAPADIRRVAEEAAGLSCADIAEAVRKAALAPLRGLQGATHFKRVEVHGEGEGKTESKWTKCEATDPNGEERAIFSIPPDEIDVPPVTIEVVLSAFHSLRPSVTPADADLFNKFIKERGWDC